MALFGWPSAAAAVATFCLALLTPSRKWLGFAGATIAMPFCAVLSRSPTFRAPGLIALGANVLSAYLFYRGRRDIAFACLVPFMMIATILAVFALRHITLLV
jgi:hypothetical protein